MGFRVLVPYRSHETEVVVNRTTALLALVVLLGQQSSWCAWEATGPTALSAEVISMKLMGNVLLLGTKFNGVQRSVLSDGGFCAAESTLNVHYYARLFQKGPKVYSLTDGMYREPNGFYESADTGRTWTSIAACPVGSVWGATDSFFVAWGDSTLYYLSGSTWKAALSAGANSAWPPAVSAKHVVFNGRWCGADCAEWHTFNPPRPIYGSPILEDVGWFCTTDSGVFASFDSGKTWQEYGLKANSVISISYADSVLYAFTNTANVLGYARRVIGGQWNPVAYTPMAMRGDTLVTACNEGIMVSLNRGESWHKTKALSKANSVSSLAFAGGMLYAGSSGGLTGMAQSGPGMNGAVVSSDFGATWKVSRAGGNSSRIVGNSAYVFLLDGSVYRHPAADTGSSWESIGIPYSFCMFGTPSAPMPGYGVGGIVCSESLFCAASACTTLLQASRDNGVNWELLQVPASSANFLSHGQKDLYFSTGNSVYRIAGSSIDSLGYPPSGSPTALCVQNDSVFVSSGQYFWALHNAEWHLRTNAAPRYATDLCAVGDSIFMATGDSGVFMSRNRGSDWERFSDGLGCASINMLQPAPGWLFASGACGIYRTALPVPMGAQPMPDRHASGGSMPTVHAVSRPGSLELRVSCVDAGGVSAVVFDARGRIVATLTPLPERDRQICLRWTHGGRSGVFFAAVKSDGNTHVVKVNLVSARRRDR